MEESLRGIDRRRFTVALAWGPGDILDDEARQIDDLELVPLRTGELNQPIGESLIRERLVCEEHKARREEEGVAHPPQDLSDRDSSHG